MVFDQAWGWLRTHFHDPAMNGADWAKVRAEFAPRVAGASAPPTELARLRLDDGRRAQRLALRRAPRRDPARTTGRLGLRFDRAEYERSGALRVTG